MPQVFGNNASASINVDLSSSGTTVSVLSADATAFPIPHVTMGNYFYATLDDGTNSEVVKVTGVGTSGSSKLYTVVRNIDGGGAHAFLVSNNTKFEQRIPKKALEELAFPKFIAAGTNTAHTFGFESGRLQGGTLDESKMAGNKSICYGDTASYWDGSGTVNRLQYNKSAGGVVFGKGNINHGWAEGGAAIGFGCMVGVDGATLEANGSTAMGWFTNAYRMGAFAAGGYNQAFGIGSTALGWGCTASAAYGNVAMGEGCVTPVTSPSSGVYTTFNGCVAVGRFNKFDDGQHRTFSVGVGTADNARYTAFYVRHTGTTWSSVSGATGGASGVGFPTLYRANRHNGDSSAGQGGVLSGELYLDSNGYVRMKL